MAKTLIGTKEVRGIMTKSNLPVGGYSVNPYVGCTHACKYCYASFMKRFSGHKEEWGTFLDGSIGLQSRIRRNMPDNGWLLDQ